jgi:hypothetical protein
MADEVTVLGQLTQAFDALRATIGLAKGTVDSISDLRERAAAKKSVEELERSAQLAEADMAKAFGYQLCRCKFPPQVMLTVGFNDNGDYKHQCPACGSVVARRRPRMRAYRSTMVG